MRGDTYDNIINKMNKFETFEFNIDQMAQTEAKNGYTVNNQLFRFVELNIC